jgi:phosphate acetyltransferase
MDAAGAAQVMTTDRLVYAATMVREREADGTIGGAVNTTADTVRTAFQIIGRAEGVKTVSSFFLMLLEREHHGQARILVFADCALIVQPNSDELAQIALSSAASYISLVKDTPRVAMLSFSTAGSARHKHVERVRQASELVTQQNPALIVDGDIQFDAAVIPDICIAKAPNSPLKGISNVFVFPSLEAGNIGYKIAQRIGAADAIGPILQGLARPANDLSRGCSADDVYRLLAVTAVQAKGLQTV